MPRRRASVWPSKVKFTSSMPWRSAHAPNSASAPGAAPLKRMKSVLFMAFVIALSVLVAACLLLLLPAGRRYAALSCGRSPFDLAQGDSELVDGSLGLRL